MVLVDCARVEVEDLGDHPDLAARIRDRLADVASLQQRELLGVLLDERSQPAQQPGAVRRAQPRARRETQLSPRDRSVGLVDSRRSELGDRLLGGRVDDGDHPRASPVPAGLLHERLEERQVLALLRMPEDADGEALRRILERLDRPVVGPPASRRPSPIRP